MYSGCIEEGHSIVRSFAEYQRQLSPAEDQTVNPFTLFHFVDDGEKVIAGLGQEHIFEQLAQILLVDIVLFIFSRNDDVETGPREYVRIKTPLHPKAPAHQANSPHPQPQTPVAT